MKSYSLGLLIIFCLVGCAVNGVPQKPDSSHSNNEAASVIPPVKFSGKIKAANLATGALVWAVSLGYPNAPLNALSMTISGNSLYMAGSPVGAMIVDISHPEAPTKVFAAVDDIAHFAPIGAWSYNFYGSGAMAVSNGGWLMSGTYGSSYVDISHPTLSVETGRFPGVDINGMPLTDEHFIYKGLVIKANRSYGFRQQGYAVTAALGRSSATVLGTTSYPAAGAVTSATLVDNTIVVAFTNSLMTCQLDSIGNLDDCEIYDGLRPTYVTSTPQRIYVQSSAVDGDAPAGIYVFDRKAKPLSFISSNQFANFAVSDDDSHLFANRDAQWIEIYRLQ